MVALNVNGQQHEVEIEPEAPLLWAIREQLALTGTKFGCGVAACGACTIHLDGQAVRSCSVSVAAAVGRQITTIEGLAPNRSHPLQQAWIAEQVPQCGYCQSGMIMAAAALLAVVPQPNEQQIAQAMTNICRCGTYQRVKLAIQRAARQHLEQGK